MTQIDHLVETTAEEIIGSQGENPRVDRYRKLPGFAGSSNGFWEFQEPPFYNNAFIKQIVITCRNAGYLKIGNKQMIFNRQNITLILYL